jgi:hypothetical protein
MRPDSTVLTLAVESGIKYVDDAVVRIEPST